MECTRKRCISDIFVLVTSVSTIPEEESELLEKSLRLQQEQLTVQLRKHKEKLQLQERTRQEALLKDELRKEQEKERSSILRKISR